MRVRDDRGRSALGAMLAMVLVSGVCGVLVAGLIVPVAGLLGLGTRSVADGFQSLPDTLREQPTPQRTRILDSEGNHLAWFYRQNRQDVPLEDVAPVMQRAILAIEDYRFYEHGALDVRGTVRAFVNNAAEQSVQGGSSITQQLVKLTLVNQARNAAQREEATRESYARKLRELRYAMAMEEEYSKDEILEKYLNLAYFGDGAYGVQAAAQHYFSKPASKLELREAALLAGLVQNPVQYTPTDYPDVAERRRNTVMARMAQIGWVKERRANKEMRRGLGLDERDFDNGCVPTKAQFYCDYVRQVLLADPALGETARERKRTLDEGGLRVKTNVDLAFQRSAERAARQRVFPRDEALGLISMVEPGTGKVRAIAQSKIMGDDEDAGETYLNFSVPKEYGDSNGFPTGSTFKVFSLAAALDEGIPPSFTVNATPTYSYPSDGSYLQCNGESWYPSPGDQVTNSTESGLMNMYSGTRLSVNTFFAQLLRETGLCAPWRLAKSMGVDVRGLNTPTDEGGSDQVPTFPLGVTDVDVTTLAGAYATFPARGIWCEPTPVDIVRTVDGEVLRRFDKNCERLLKPSTADTVNDILRGVQEPGGFGYNAGTGLSVPSAAKTGTGQNNKSVSYAGYTTDIATAATIVGINDVGGPEDLPGKTIAGQYLDFGAVSGSGLAAPMWAEAMRGIEGRLSGRDFRPATNTAPEVVTPPPAPDPEPEELPDPEGVPTPIVPEPRPTTPGGRTSLLAPFDLF